MGKIVRSTLSDAKLTPKQKRELPKLAALPDETIDYSDIPPLTEKFWENAIRNPWYGYQSRLNSLLRTAMLEQLHGKNEPLRGKKKSA
jgi:hypothetical protein